MSVVYQSVLSRTETFFRHLRVSAIFQFVHCVLVRDRRVMTENDVRYIEVKLIPPLRFDSLCSAPSVRQALAQINEELLSRGQPTDFLHG